jgi:hypothetical protein
MPPKISDAYARLMDRVYAEALQPKFRECKQYLELDIPAALALIYQLQVALSVAGNKGTIAEQARNTIEDLLKWLEEEGFTAHVDAARVNGSRWP